MKIDRVLMSEQLIALHKEFESKQTEIKRYQDQIERFKRQRDEQAKGQSEDGYKQIIDNMVYRERLDVQKLEIYQLKKRVRETVKFEEMFRETQSKLEIKEKLEFEENEARLQTVEREKCNLIGHIKNPLKDGKTLFALETCSFLEVKEILKF